MTDGKSRRPSQADRRDENRAAPLPDTHRAAGPKPIVVHVNGGVRRFDRFGAVATLDATADSLSTPVRGSESAADPREIGRHRLPDDVPADQVGAPANEDPQGCRRYQCVRSSAPSRKFRPPAAGRDDPGLPSGPRGKRRSRVGAERTSSASTGSDR